jgi:hypothetical protein
VIHAIAPSKSDSTRATQSKPRRARPSELETHEATIAAHLRGRVHDFRIVPHDDGVILLGRANSFYAKQLAQHAVMNLCRAIIVSNEIEVEPY